MNIASREHTVRFLFPDGLYIGTLYSTGVLQVDSINDRDGGPLLLMVPLGVYHRKGNLVDGISYVEYDVSASIGFGLWTITVHHEGFMFARNEGVHESITVRAGMDDFSDEG